MVIPYRTDKEDQEDHEHREAYEQALRDWARNLDSFELIQLTTGYIRPEVIEVTTLGDTTPKFVVNTVKVGSNKWMT